MALPDQFEIGAAKAGDQDFQQQFIGRGARPGDVPQDEGADLFDNDGLHNVLSPKNKKVPAVLRTAGTFYHQVRAMIFFGRLLAPGSTRAPPSRTGATGAVDAGARSPDTAAGPPRRFTVFRCRKTGGTVGGYRRKIKRMLAGRDSRL